MKQHVSQRLAPRQLYRSYVISAIAIAGLFGLFLSPTTGGAQAPHQHGISSLNSPLGQVRFIKGGLTVQPPHKRQQAGKKNMLLYTAYRIQTKASQLASIRFSDGTLLHLNQLTDVVLRNPHVTYVNKGEVDQIMTPGTNHVIQTATAVAAAIGTEADVRIVGKTTIVSVIEGAMRVTNKLGTVIVKTNQQTIVAPNQAPQQPTTSDSNPTSIWIKPIPAPAQPVAQNIALDFNGGHVVGASSQAAGLSPHIAPSAPTSLWDASYINDGRLDRGWQSAQGHDTNQWVKIGFAGDQLRTILGVVIDPAATSGQPKANDLKDFKIRVSTTDTKDASFRTVYKGTLQQQDSLQTSYFPFAVAAKYIELYALNNYGGPSIAAAELEVAAVPNPSGVGPTITPTPTSTATTPTPTSTATPTTTPTTTTVTCGALAAHVTGVSQAAACKRVTVTANAANVGIGTPVTITATAVDSLAGSGLRMVVTSSTGDRHLCDVNVDTCSFDVTQTSPVTLTYTAAAEDAGGKKAGATSTAIAIKWDNFQILSIDPPTQSVPAGQPAKVTVTTNYALPANYTIRVSLDDGMTFSCTVNPCVWNPTETTPGTHSVTADVRNPAGAKIDTAPPLVAKITWVATWTGTVSLTVDYTKLPVGVNATLTATASTSVSGSGYKIVISAGGSNVFSQDTGTLFTKQVVSNQPGSFTFTAWVEDASGNKVALAPNTVTVTWVAWSVQISADQTSVNVGTTVHITADTNFDVSGTGFTIKFVSSTNDTASCNTGSKCVWSVSSNSAGTITFRAYVVDSSGNAVAQSPNDVSVTWKSSTPNYSITLSASNTNPAQYQTVTLTATSSPAVSGTIHIQIRDAGNGFVYNQCSNTNVCTQDVPFNSSTTGCQAEGTGTCSYVAIVLDSSSNTILATSNVVTIHWSVVGLARVYAQSAQGPSHLHARIDGFMGDLLSRMVRLAALQHHITGARHSSVGLMKPVRSMHKHTLVNQPIAWNALREMWQVRPKYQESALSTG